MKVQGKPAALVAITAALTLITGVLATRHTTSPQVHAQTVSSASVTPVDQELLTLKRASRSRRISPTPRQTAKILVSNTASSPKPVPRSTATHQAVIRQYEHPSVSRGTSAYAWAHTTDAYKVANCESGDRSTWDHYNGNPHLRDGQYHGKWQMDADFWRTYGGLAFASDAADASEGEQDIVAYKGYLARGWEPWSCSRIMGVQ